MKRLALKMHLNAGMAEEYQRRHDEIWPDLKRVLTEHGIADYSIFFDKDTDSLFAVLRVADETRLEDLSDLPIMKEWWSHMADIMQTNSDQSPVTLPLTQVFHMD